MRKNKIQNWGGPGEGCGLESRKFVLPFWRIPVDPTMLVSRDTKGWNEEPAGGGGRRRGRSKGRLKSLQNPKFELEISMFMSFVSLNLGWVAFDSSHALESPPPRTSSSSFFLIAAGIFVLELPMTDPPFGATRKILRSKRKSSLGPVFLFFFWSALDWPLTNNLPEEQVLPPRYASASAQAHTQNKRGSSLSILFCRFIIHIISLLWSDIAVFFFFAVCQFLSVFFFFFFFFFASQKKMVNFVRFLFRVLQIGSCSAYQWRSHGGGMSRFLSSSSSSSAGWVASASWCITGKSRAQEALVDSLFAHAMMFYLGDWHQP